MLDRGSPYQVFAAGWIGLLAGALPQRFAGKLIRGAAEKVLLIVVGIFASFAFGILMDLQFWPWVLGSSTQLSYIPGGELSENLSRFITFHFASSMAWDIPRAILTTVLRTASLTTPLEYHRHRRESSGLCQSREWHTGGLRTASLTTQSIYQGLDPGGKSYDQLNNWHKVSK